MYLSQSEGTIASSRSVMTLFSYFSFDSASTLRTERKCIEEVKKFMVTFLLVVLGLLVSAADKQQHFFYDSNFLLVVSH